MPSQKSDLPKPPPTPPASPAPDDRASRSPSPLGKLQAEIKEIQADTRMATLHRNLILERVVQLETEKTPKKETPASAEPEKESGEKPTRYTHQWLVTLVSGTAIGFFLGFVLGYFIFSGRVNQSTAPQPTASQQPAETADEPSPEEEKGLNIKQIRNRIRSLQTPSSEQAGSQQ